jgi:hypothetical protein
MKVPCSLAAVTLAAMLSTALPAHADASQGATDTAGASHVRPASGMRAPGQSRLRSGWIGVGINTAILVVKIAIPSIARRPLSRT